MFRRQTTLCREGWYYLAITAVVLGGAVIKEVNLLLILAGFLLGPLLLNWRLVRTNLRGLRVQRKLPPALCAGDPLSVGLHVSNDRPRPASWAVVVEDQIGRESSNRHNHSRLHLTPCPGVAFPYVPGGESRREAYRGRLVERGCYQFGPLRLSTRFPFGLFSRTIAIGEVERLIVLPRLGRLTAGWKTRRLDAFVADRRHGQAGCEGDFYGVRGWHSGDGRRLVHWRSSARLGKLVVRQFEQPRNRDVAVVLDLWQPDAPTPKHLENVELAVSFAATVLADLCRKGGSNAYLALNTTGPECVGGPASPALLQGLMERLAVVEASARDVLPALLAHALERIAAGTEIVLVCTRTNNFSDDARFAALRSNPMLRERARRLRCVDTSSEQLANFFQAE
jgi:uncharacterized protein (DUF58 family)